MDFLSRGIHKVINGSEGKNYARGSLKKGKTSVQRGSKGLVPGGFKIALSSALGLSSSQASQS